MLTFVDRRRILLEPQQAINRDHRRSNRVLDRKHHIVRNFAKLLMNVLTLKKAQNEHNLKAFYNFFFSGNLLIVL